MKEGEWMKSNCSICNNNYNNLYFKGGYVCEDCLQFIKENK